MSDIDVSLYLVTDRRLCGDRSLRDVVLAAVRGGVTIVQLREKDCGSQEFIDLGIDLKRALTPLGIPLLINDRVDVAVAVGADGVHLGQSDMPCAEARRRLGPDAIIGLSVESMEQALETDGLEVDYLGVSPIHATPTKTDTAGPWGLEGLRELRARTAHRLVGIGGLNASNAGATIAAGADGIAVVSAIMSAPDPEAAARELTAAIREAVRRRSV